MSKQKKEKDTGQEIPIDFQVESKNLNYTIVLRENEIEMLKKDNEEKGSTILALESEEVHVLLLLRVKKNSRCINRNLKRWKRKLND